MNLTRKCDEKQSSYEDNKILIEDFRYYQHLLIEYFIKTVVNYISEKNNNFLTFDSLDIKEIFTYDGLYQSELEHYIVNIINNTTKEKKVFFRFNFPKLIDKNFYILNGHYYAPLLYLLDKPMSIKENSITLTSLFSSLTLYIKNRMVIFGGNNIPLDIFCELFMNKDDDEDTNKIRNVLGFNKIPEIKIVNYFNNILSIKAKKDDEIISHIERFFFDEYTKYLYTSCYFGEREDLDITLKDIIKYSVLRFIDNNHFNFIDLNNKRLIFIELLLSPILQKAATAAHQAKRGFKNDELSFAHDSIIKNFQKSQEKKKSSMKKDIGGFHGLSGKNLYDIVNLYSGIIIHKCSFIKPGMSHPPTSVNNIDKTHFEKICPITVSSTNVGETVSIVPETYVDIFGQFLDLKGE